MPKAYDRPIQQPTTSTAPGSVAQKRCFTLGARKYKDSTASTVNTTATVQWIYGQASASSHERFVRKASHVPNCGPRIITASAVSRSTPTSSVSATASGLVTQNGRASSTS